MSLDARICAVTVVHHPVFCDTCEGTGCDPDNGGLELCPNCLGKPMPRSVVHIHLEPRRPSEIAGQRMLEVVNPPTLDLDILGALVGIEIWGGSNLVMIGQRKWARRVGVTKIQLVEAE